MFGRAPDRPVNGRYYASAMEQKPWVIALTGPPGAGKSTTAAALGRRLGAAVLDQDSMTNPLVDIVADQLGATDYSDARLAAVVREARYACLIRAAADCSRAGVSSVLVAPFTAERRDAVAWERFADAVRCGGGRPRLAWLRIDPIDLVRRLRERSSPRDVNKLADIDAFLRDAELDAPVGPFIEVDATLPADQQALHLRNSLHLD